VTFKVVPPWHRNWLIVLPAGGGMLALLISSIVFGSRYYVQRRESHTLRDQMLEQELSANTLLRSLTHAIKNPLTIIETCSEHLALLEGTEPAEANNAIQHIQDQVNQARQIVNQLLTVTTLPEFQVFDLKVELELLLHETLEKNPDWAQQITVSKQCDPIPEINGDRNKLINAFENLFVNACQAMEETGGTLTLRLTSTDNTIRVEVQDTGYGIEWDAIREIFKPLYTTKKEQGGTGLGLWMTQQIIEEHRGKIDIESQPGVGTTVCVELPIAPTS
jgi:two-component system, NtrC family, sensor kinase